MGQSPAYIKTLNSYFRLTLLNFPKGYFVALNFLYKITGFRGKAPSIKNMKKILLLGSTGSIGTSTISVIEQFQSDFSVVGLSSSKNVDLLLKQCQQCKPQSVYIKDDSARDLFQSKNTQNIKVYGNDENDMVRFVEEADFDVLVTAVTGFAGFLPTIKAIKMGKTIALANKETLVVGGDIIMPLAKRHNVDLIPIDSEHSAIFQILRHFESVDVHKVIITASGGPFYQKPIEEFFDITLEQALKHPTWNMGSKITIDSATMMNKGFEVIEAHHLFGLEYDKIDTIVHPQSIIHSMVEFVDGEIYAQLGITDMKYPIQNALTYPFVKNTPFDRLRLSDIKEMTFFETDMSKFPLLMLAYLCGRLGGLYPTVLNAANEVCVEAFLNKKIHFLDIPRIVSEMCSVEIKDELSIENIIKVDKSTRYKTEQAIVDGGGNDEST